MNNQHEFLDIEPAAAAAVPTAAQVAGGVPIPPVRLLQIMSPDDWEGFTEEWLTYYKGRGEYHSIRRYSGPGDLGLDVVGFTSSEGFARPWDSYQCKRYDHALRPGDVYGEIGKIIYHSCQKTPPFNQTCRVPRRHVFVSPLGVSISLGRLLKDANRLKEEVRKKWDRHCVTAIGTGIAAPLEGALLTYFDAFDFSMFEDRTAVQLIQEHSQTVFYAPRFGGGLPPREQPEAPPSEPAKVESVYLRKLLDSYADHFGEQFEGQHDLEARPDLYKHFNRQRILFYSAESLRNFARDRTPPKTFASLQDDVYHGVIDLCDGAHTDAFERLRAVIQAAGTLDISGNALVAVTRVTDKQGVCHQLANDDRLTWVKTDV